MASHGCIGVANGCPYTLTAEQVKLLAQGIVGEAVPAADCNKIVEDYFREEGGDLVDCLWEMLQEVDQLMQRDDDDDVSTEEEEEERPMQILRRDGGASSSPTRGAAYGGHGALGESSRQRSNVPAPGLQRSESVITEGPTQGSNPFERMMVRAGRRNALSSPVDTQEDEDIR